MAAEKKKGEKFVTIRVPAAAVAEYKKMAERREKEKKRKR